MVDFTIAYLLEKPPFIIDFGVTYFQKLKRERDGVEGAGARASQSASLSGARTTRGDGGGERSSQVVNGMDGEKDELSFLADDNSPPPPELIDGGVVSKAEFREKISTGHALDIAKIGAGEVCSLGENEATWIWHMAAKYVLEKPNDIVDWCLQYYENEKGRWAYN